MYLNYDTVLNAILNQLRLIETIVVFELNFPYVNLAGLHGLIETIVVFE